MRKLNRKKKNALCLAKRSRVIYTILKMRKRIKK